MWELIFQIHGWIISCKIAFRWLSPDFTDGKSTLVQVMDPFQAIQKAPISLISLCFLPLRSWNLTEDLETNKTCFIPQDKCFCKFHEILVKTLTAIVQRNVTDRQMDRQTGYTWSAYRAACCSWKHVVLRCRKCLYWRMENLTLDYTFCYYNPVHALIPYMGQDTDVWLSRHLVL